MLLGHNSTDNMAKVKLSSWFVHALILWHYGTCREVNIDNRDLELIQIYRKIVEAKWKNESCSEDHNLLGSESIFQDYSFWDKEISTVNNVANYLTSMWRFKGTNNLSLIENEASIYTLTKTIALSSDQVYGSVICFDKYKFQNKSRFCPYAFKESTGRNRTIIRDLGRNNDYHTTPEPPKNNNITKHTFVWWHVGKNSLSNNTRLKQNTVHYDMNLDNPSSNATGNSSLYNITSSYVPIKYGKWTTPYYDCFGGKTWMITYLAPFYDETEEFL